MSSVIIAGNTSGSITISAPAVSGSSVLTLPASTDTLIGKATTDTLTNKTLTGAVFTAMPATTTAQSMVRLNTANGYGSTNTVIRRFTNTVTNQGSDITYADSATLGCLFTINTNGVYAISYNDQFNTTQDMGISLNTTAPTTRIGSIPVAEILASTYSAGAHLGGSCGGSFYLPSGSLIRAHTYTNGTGLNPNLCQFTITRVA